MTYQLLSIWKKRGREKFFVPPCKDALEEILRILHSCIQVRRHSGRST